LSTICCEIDAVSGKGSMDGAGGGVEGVGISELTIIDGVWKRLGGMEETDVG
jgi:hypothetical protein